MSLFNNLKVKYKLLVVFGIIAVISGLASLLSVLSIRSLDKQINIIVNDRYVKVNKMNEVKAEVLEIAELLRNMLIVDDQKQIDAYMNRVRDLQASVADKIKFFDVAIKSEEGKKLLSELKAVREEYIKEREKQYKLLKEGKKKEALDLLLGSVSNAQQTYLNTISKNIKFQEKQMVKAVENADSEYHMSIILVIIGGFISLSIMTGFIILLTKGIAAPLNQCTDIAQKMSSGDLSMSYEFSTKTTTKDEIGQLVSAIRGMQEKWRNIVLELKSSSDTLASASQQLSASSEQMSRGVSEQSGRASQIATSATEMSQTVIDIAKNTSNIASSAVETSRIAKDGEEVVSKSVNEVKAIAQTVSESAGFIGSLGERSQQIGEIVNVIKDIADQTNLLALNAAIEAARAGEQGRGFAVVADEVRKLAERTSKATSEIGSMIGAIQDEVQKAVVSMNEAIRRVDTGVEYSTNAGDALREIVRSVENLQSMVQQIASATEEMSSVSEHISGDIETIATVSNETSKSSEQITASSSDLARLATKLTELVRRFKV
ncbi:MAG: methyl-accepting chemotaxis protein [Thermodesulfovibrionales bacterium]